MFFKVIENETSLRDDESDRLTERLVANLVGMNQLSFLPCNIRKFMSSNMWFIKLTYYQQKDLSDGQITYSPVEV